MFPAVDLNFPNPVETLADLFDRDAELELVLTALRSPTRRPIVIAVVAHVPGDPPEPWQLIEALCALTRPAER